MTDIRTEQGVLVGAEHDGVHSFRGIPYAAPPIGERRWRPPARPARWNGTRDATRFGNAAIQTADTGMDLRAPQSEDCLYLNVWTTAPSRAERQPVMVWIHGGGFLNGSSSLSLWPGDQLCRSGVTVVSINYRLGAFGFLAHPEAGANFGVQDWVAALNWVQANIDAFGGDPDNVTVFGQSAGGAAARALLHTPAARGLFHRAIIQSAGFEDYAVVGSPSYQRSTTASAALLKRLGATDLDGLRHAPAESVREASLALSSISPPPGQLHTPANLTWYPVVDDTVVTAELAGWPQDVPVMLGCTQDEARFFVQPTKLYAHPEVRPEDAYTAETLSRMTAVLAGDRAEDVLGHYATSGMTPYEAIADLITAGVWHEPAQASLQRFAALGRTSYAYRFTRISPGARQSGLRAQHSAEIPYLFGTMSPAAAYSEIDEQVSRDTQHAWTEFARTGTPRTVEGTPWPTYRSDVPAITRIGDTTTHQRELAPTPVAERIAATRAGAPAR